MRNRDGLKLLDYKSFSEDVEGQIARRKLRLSKDEQLVIDMLPAIEEAMAANGIVYEHSGLNGIATGQLAVVRIKGQLYRMGVTYPSGEAPEEPSRLYLDSHWCGADGADGDLHASIDFHAGLTAQDVQELLAGFAAKIPTRSRA